MKNIQTAGIVKRYHPGHYDKRAAAARLIDMKSEQEEPTQKTGRYCNWQWYEKVLDAGSTFVGKITGYYDYKKATEGVNPVTGEKLEDPRIAVAVIDPSV
ncbi:pre-toxin TG domain-containing protein [Bacillus glycinifermentans]|uniref:pre-toxin TG domain-containing protein n=1 Tax=Bacillus glycinifermentans TaxID=1664069 RepID=UPI002DBE4666|nr:pre-toxin TG domain-containing protein [Bacillus glycinifermentans]MEC3605906.1 pre-toxin TG domain-containing protein [Bacillus glycinifermentans]